MIEVVSEGTDPSRATNVQSQDPKAVIDEVPVRLPFHPNLLRKEIEDVAMLN